MALQGTIDAFPVADVLQLLARSRKSGRLIVEGDRSTAQVFVADGAATGGSVKGAASTDLADVVVELLRYRAGSFLFEPGVVSPEEAQPEDLPALLESAFERISAWAEIEAVVPSTAHRLHLVDEIDAAGVHIASEEWPVIIAGGCHAPVADLVAVLGLPEIETCTRIASLVTRGLVTVEGPGTDLVPAPTHPPVIEHAVAVDSGADPVAVAAVVADDPAAVGEQVGDAAFEVVLLDEEPTPEAFPERFPIDDLLGDTAQEDPWIQFEPHGHEDRLAASQTFEDPGPLAWGPGVAGAGPAAAFSDEVTGAGFDHAADGFGGPAGFVDDVGLVASAGGPPQGSTFAEVTDGPLLTATFDGSGAFTEVPVTGDPAAESAADEVLRQMSKLSPKAAEAIAAALGSGADPASSSRSTAGHDASDPTL